MGAMMPEMANQLQAAQEQQSAPQEPQQAQGSGTDSATAEDVKTDLASAMPLTEDRKVRIRGRDLLSPQAMDIEYTSRQAYQAIHEPCKAIIAAIRWVLERTPPELSADVMRTGIHLTGGVAQLYAMDQFIATELGIPVLIAKEPADCTALGLGYIVENMPLLIQSGRMPQLG